METAFYQVIYTEGANAQIIIYSLSLLLNQIMGQRELVFTWIASVRGYDLLILESVLISWYLYLRMVKICNITLDCLDKPLQGDDT